MHPSINDVTMGIQLRWYVTLPGHYIVFNCGLLKHKNSNLLCTDINLLTSEYFLHTQRQRRIRSKGVYCSTASRNRCWGNNSASLLPLPSRVQSMHWLSLPMGSSWLLEPLMAEFYCGTLVMDSWLESSKATRILFTPSSSAGMERFSPLVGVPVTFYVVHQLYVFTSSVYLNACVILRCNFLFNSL